MKNEKIKGYEKNTKGERYLRKRKRKKTQEEGQRREAGEIRERRKTKIAEEEQRKESREIEERGEEGRKKKKRY